MGVLVYAMLLSGRNKVRKKCQIVVILQFCQQKVRISTTALHRPTITLSISFPSHRQRPTGHAPLPGRREHGPALAGLRPPTPNQQHTPRQRPRPQRKHQAHPAHSARQCQGGREGAKGAWGRDGRHHRRRPAPRCGRPVEQGRRGRGRGQGQSRRGGWTAGHAQ